MSTLKCTAITVFSILVSGFGIAQAQSPKQPDVLFSFNVKNASSTPLEVFVADWNRGQKEVYHGTLGGAQSASGQDKAVAKTPRPTSKDPETNLHWKVVAKVDEDGKPAKETTPKPHLPTDSPPKQQQKQPLTWCGETNTHADGQTVTVGLQANGVGKSC